MKLRIAVMVATIAAVAVVLAAPAGAQSETLNASPQSGGPGTVINLSSVSPCTLPQGVTGAPFVKVTLTRGSQTLAQKDFTLATDGSWSGTITVPASATAGAASLLGYCFASPQAEGAIFAYQAVAFTVTGELARTGSSTMPLMLAALLFLAFGFASLRWSARRPVAARR